MLRLPGVEAHATSAKNHCDWFATVRLARYAKIPMQMGEGLWVHQVAVAAGSSPLTKDTVATSCAMTSLSVSLVAFEHECYLFGSFESPIGGEFAEQVYLLDFCRSVLLHYSGDMAIGIAVVLGYFVENGDGSGGDDGPEVCGVLNESASVVPYSVGSLSICVGVD